MQLLALVALSTQLAATPVAELRREALMHALHNGGYTVVLRHARTDRANSKEQPGSYPPNRADQRNLSADGVRDAALMGAVFRKYQIPFDEIAVSPMFRTKETAELAAGTPTLVTMALRTLDPTPEQVALIAKAPARRKNRLIVTHHFVIERNVPGIKPGDIGESEAAVVHTVNGKIALVGRITLADWEQLAGIDAAPAVATQASTPSPASHTAANSTIENAVRKWVEGFNTGDTARMRVVYETFFTANPDRPTEVRLRTYLDNFQQLGALTLQSVKSATEDEVTFEVGSKHGTLLLTAIGAKDQPGRLSTLRISSSGGGHP